MADHQYLSIGEVLGLLLEDFPDVTISKIRFLESQGLIEPERTPSGYRKFYDCDVELLRAILHEQKANFLPLKVIRDRIESGAIDSDITGGRTPPRGIRNVEQIEQQGPPREAAVRDSVFRRTDGGPEWAGGQALIPGRTQQAVSEPDPSGSGSKAPITASIPVTPAAPPIPPSAGKPSHRPPIKTMVTPTTVISDKRPGAKPQRPVRPAAASTVVASLIEPPPLAGREPGPASSSGPERPPTEIAPTEMTQTDMTQTEPAQGARVAADHVSTEPARVQQAADVDAGDTDVRELPYNSEELCAAASITAAQLAALQDYGIVSSRGSGMDTSFQPAAVDIARIAGQLLAQGIDARHLRAWRQAAERESALFEQRIMPLLRQRNPKARQAALDSLSELAGLGSELHTALVDSLLQHHFDGT